MRAPAALVLGSLLLSACIPCDLEVRGICVSFNALPREQHGTDEEWTAYLDHAIERSLAHWGRGPNELEGWTIRFKEGSEMSCGWWPFTATLHPQGCADPSLQVIRLEWPNRWGASFPTRHLPHEVGHAVGHLSHHDGRFRADARKVLDGWTWPRRHD